MKRLAILLGHIDGELSSNKDILDVYNFLSSPRGGVWDKDEIYCNGNVPFYEMCNLLHNVREAQLDYVFFYFSGHGGYVRDTEIVLNPQGERISERYIANLAPRQLNIFDCCRAPILTNFAEDSMEMIKESSDSIRRCARNVFNNRIMEAYPQQMSLYACSEGESAYDTGHGGIYTQNLLFAIQNSSDEVLLAARAHSIATELTQSIRPNQHPDYMMAKLPIRLQLPLAINPDVILI